MKKSFFGFSAKVALAVLAVCSFALTSCYEKSQPAPQEEPVFWVVGTVYDAATSQTLNADVTVGSASVSGPSFAVKVNGSKTEVTKISVSAKMEGYKDASREVSVAPATYNQISVTTADLAMVAEDAEYVGVAEKVNDAKKIEAIVNAYGFPKGEVKDGVFYVSKFFTLSAADSHNAHDVHAICPDHESHDAHGITYCSTDPVEVEVAVYSGYISEDAENMVEVANNTMNTILIGATYADFEKNSKESKKFVLNADGTGHLLGWWLDRAFEVYNITYEVHGVTFTCTCIVSVGLNVDPLFDSHDSHDLHDQHGYWNHNAGVGGGAGDNE